MGVTVARARVRRRQWPPCARSRCFDVVGGARGRSPPLRSAPLFPLFFFLSLFVFCLFLAVWALARFCGVVVCVVSCGLLASLLSSWLVGGMQSRPWRVPRVGGPTKTKARAAARRCITARTTAPERGFRARQRGGEVAGGCAAPHRRPCVSHPPEQSGNSPFWCGMPLKLTPQKIRADARKKQKNTQKAQKHPPKAQKRLFCLWWPQSETARTN